jgi:antirestriction protein ArdC
MTTSSKERFDVYRAITDQIIASIEAGTEHPQMPWHRAGGSIERPTNVESKNAYRGVNTVALWASAYCQQFDHGLWGAYRQWQEKGAQVRKGEKSSIIIFYRDLQPHERDTQSSGDDDDRGNRFFVARASRVFNVAQVDGFELPAIEPSIDRIDPCVAAEAFIAATGANITVVGERAFYNRTNDSITMPDRHRFVGTKTSSATEGWYSTLLHELTHWSGAESTLITWAALKPMSKHGSTRCHAPTHGAKPHPHHANSRSFEREYCMIVKHKCFYNGLR